jgi:hypothetical protein
MFDTFSSFTPPWFLIGHGGDFFQGTGIGEHRVDGRTRKTSRDLIEQVLALSRCHCVDSVCS